MKNNIKYYRFKWRHSNAERYFRVKDDSKKVLQIVVRTADEGRGNRKGWFGIYYLSWAGFCTSYWHHVFKTYLKTCSKREFYLVFDKVSKQLKEEQ
jgi:hypothetical protein